jgi:methylated-DNA-protein-cysteine methyltransferase-like protein
MYGGLLGKSGGKMSPFISPPNQALFREKVWDITRQIPAGKVATYGQIAAMIPPPEGMNLKEYDAYGPRWVGGAMAACPEDVPWQRVINSQGKISLRKDGDSTEQRERLEAEGVVFDARDRVDLNVYRWPGPPLDWLKDRGLSLPPHAGKPLQTQMKL